MLAKRYLNLTLGESVATTRPLNRGSKMSANVLLILLNDLGKRLFRNEFAKVINSILQEHEC